MELATKLSYSASTLGSFRPCYPLLKRPSRIVKASNGTDHGGSRLVDENLITLRMRIREIKMSDDRTSEQKLQSDWTEWEKKHFLNYNEHVCEALGFVQNHLMDTRPCMALGFVALVILSAPISMGVVIFHFIEFGMNI